MPRDQAVVLAELEVELAMIPRESTPDLTRAIELGLELGRPQAISVRIPGLDMAKYGLLYVLWEVSRGSEAVGDGTFRQDTILATAYYFELGEWQDVATAMLTWRENFHLTFPRSLPSIEPAI